MLNFTTMLHALPPRHAEDEAHRQLSQRIESNNDNYDQKTSRGNTNNIAAHVKQLPVFSKEP
jgi:hypothetical protein